MHGCNTLCENSRFPQGDSDCQRREFSFPAGNGLNKPKNYEQFIPNQPYCKSEGLFRFQHANLSLIRS